jgi:hypothetical protein
LRIQITHSFKAPGFNPRAYEVISWFLKSLRLQMQLVPLHHAGAECHPRDVCEVFRSAKLARPTYAREPERLRQMVDIDEHIIVSCWDGKTLVGLGVALCDGVWVCFLRDLVGLYELNSVD